MKLKKSSVKVLLIGYDPLSDVTYSQNKKSYLLRQYYNNDFKLNNFAAGDEKCKQPFKPKLKKEIGEDLSWFFSDSKCNMESEKNISMRFMKIKCLCKIWFS